MGYVLSWVAWLHALFATEYLDLLCFAGRQQSTDSFVWLGCIVPPQPTPVHYNVVQYVSALLQLFTDPAQKLFPICCVAYQCVVRNREMTRKRDLRPGRLVYYPWWQQQSHKHHVSSKIICKNSYRENSELMLGESPVMWFCVYPKIIIFGLPNEPCQNLRNHP